MTDTRTHASADAMLDDGDEDICPDCGTPHPAGVDPRLIEIVSTFGTDHPAVQRILGDELRRAGLTEDQITEALAGSDDSLRSLTMNLVDPGIRVYDWEANPGAKGASHHIFMRLMSTIRDASLIIQALRVQGLVLHPEHIGQFEDFVEATVRAIGKTVYPTNALQPKSTYDLGDMAEAGLIEPERVILTYDSPESEFLDAFDAEVERQRDFMAETEAEWLRLKDDENDEALSALNEKVHGHVFREAEDRVKARLIVIDDE